MTKTNEQLAAQINALPKLEPNMRKLAATAATQRTFEQAGGSLQAMTRFFSGEHILEDMAYGISFARIAVKALREATDTRDGKVNPYRGKSDEEIAGAILEQLEERKAAQHISRRANVLAQNLTAQALLGTKPLGRTFPFIIEDDTLEG